VLVEGLIAKAGRDAAMLPAGKAHVEKLATLAVGAGAARQTVTAWAVVGLGGTPSPVWADAKGRVFAWVGDLTTIRAGFEDAKPALEKAQDEAMSKRSPILARKLASALATPVAFVDVRAFVDGERFVEHQTVLVHGGKIVAVGPVAEVKIPPWNQGVSRRWQDPYSGPVGQPHGCLG
jgi:hypothetical protein